jgi:hypothetical protein
MNRKMIHERERARRRTMGPTTKTQEQAKVKKLLMLLVAGVDSLRFAIYGVGNLEEREKRDS